MKKLVLLLLCLAGVAYSQQLEYNRYATTPEGVLINGSSLTNVNAQSAITATNLTGAALVQVSNIVNSASPSATLAQVTNIVSALSVVKAGGVGTNIQSYGLFSTSLIRPLYQGGGEDFSIQESNGTPRFQFINGEETEVLNQNGDDAFQAKTNKDLTPIEIIGDGDVIVSNESLVVVGASGMVVISNSTVKAHNITATGTNFVSDAEITELNVSGSSSLGSGAVLGDDIQMTGHDVLDARNVTASGTFQALGSSVGNIIVVKTNGDENFIYSQNQMMGTIDASGSVNCSLLGNNSFVGLIFGTGASNCVVEADNGGSVGGGFGSSLDVHVIAYNGGHVAVNATGTSKKWDIESQDGGYNDIYDGGNASNVTSIADVGEVFGNIFNSTDINLQAYQAGSIRVVANGSTDVHFDAGNSGTIAVKSDSHTHLSTDGGVIFGYPPSSTTYSSDAILTMFGKIVSLPDVNGVSGFTGDANGLTNLNTSPDTWAQVTTIDTSGTFDHFIVGLVDGSVGIAGMSDVQLSGFGGQILKSQLPVGAPTNSATLSAGTGITITTNAQAQSFTITTSATIYTGSTNIGNLATSLLVTIGHTMPSTNYTPSVSFISGALGAGVAASYSTLTLTNFTVSLSAGIAGGEPLRWSVIYSP